MKLINSCASAYVCCAQGSKRICSFSILLTSLWQKFINTYLTFFSSCFFFWHKYLCTIYFAFYAIIRIDKYVLSRNKISLPTFLLNFLKRFPPTCLCPPTCLLNFANFSFLYVYSNLHVYKTLQIFPSYMFISPYTFIRNSRVCKDRLKWRLK